MIKAGTSVIINRPVEAVFAFVSNPENSPKWGSGILEVEITSAGVDGVGATARTRRQFPGKQVEFQWQVTAYEPNRLMVVNSTSGPLSMQVRYDFESVPDHKTRLRFTLKGKASGFFKLAESLVSRQAQKELEADFLRLKDLLELQA
jgi:uncharacterized membrane protein